MAPLTKEQLDASMKEFRAWRHERDAPRPPNAALITGIVKSIAPHLYELEQQIAALSARVQELESNQRVYLGVWKEGREYSPQSEVTHDGGRWYCAKRTSDKPGSSADWTLMEKSANPRSEPATANPRANGHITANPRKP